MQEDKRLPNIPVTGPFEALAYAAPALGLVTIIAGNWGSGSWRHLVHQCNMAPWLASVHEVHFAHPDPDMVMGQFEQDQWELRRIVAAEMDRVAREDGVKQASLALEKMAPMQISSHARSGQDCLSPVVCNTGHRARPDDHRAQVCRNGSRYSTVQPGVSASTLVRKTFSFPCTGRGRPLSQLTSCQRSNRWNSGWRQLNRDWLALAETLHWVNCWDRRIALLSLIPALNGRRTSWTDSKPTFKLIRSAFLPSSRNSAVNRA